MEYRVYGKKRGWPFVDCRLCVIDWCLSICRTYEWLRAKILVQRTALALFDPSVNSGYLIFLHTGT